MNRALLTVLISLIWGIGFTIVGTIFNNSSLAGCGGLCFALSVSIAVTFPLTDHTIEKDRTSKLPITSGEGGKRE